MLDREKLAVCVSWPPSTSHPPMLDMGKQRVIVDRRQENIPSLLKRSNCKELVESEYADTRYAS